MCATWWMHVIVVDDGSTDGTAAGRAPPARDLLGHDTNRGKGQAIRTGLAAVLLGTSSRTCCFSTATCSICRRKRGRCSERPRAPAPIWSWASGQFDRSRHAGLAISRQPAGQPGAVVVRRGSAARYAVRVSRVPRGGASASSADGASVMKSKPRCSSSCGDAAAESPACRSRPFTAARRSKLRPVRDTTKTCFLAVYYRFLERI